MDGNSIVNIDHEPFPDESYNLIHRGEETSHPELNERKSLNDDNCPEEDNFSFVQRFLQFINPQLPDPFDPTSVVEANLDFINDTHQHVGRLPDNVLAQIG